MCHMVQMEILLKAEKRLKRNSAPQPYLRAADYSVDLTRWQTRFCRPACILMNSSLLYLT